MQYDEAGAHTYAPSMAAHAVCSVPHGPRSHLESPTVYRATPACAAPCAGGCRTSPSASAANTRSNPTNGASGWANVSKYRFFPGSSRGSGHSGSADRSARQGSGSQRSALRAIQPCSVLGITRIAHGLHIHTPTHTHTHTPARTGTHTPHLSETEQRKADATKLTMMVQSERTASTGIFNRQRGCVRSS